MLTAPAYTTDDAKVDVVHLTFDPVPRGGNWLQLQLANYYCHSIAAESHPVVIRDFTSRGQSGGQHPKEAQATDESLPHERDYGYVGTDVFHLNTTDGINRESARVASDYLQAQGA